MEAHPESTLPRGTQFSGIVLTGGTGARLGGVDKSSLTVAGRTLLEIAVGGLRAAADIVVVGPEAAVSRPVTFVRENPPLGGPAAGLLAGLDALGDTVWVALLAVDMPGVGAPTWARLLAAAAARDGAFLHDADGRRQLAGVVRAERLRRIAPVPDQRHGLPVHRILGLLDLAEVRARGDEARDIDVWDDLAALEHPPSGRGRVRGAVAATRLVVEIGDVNLHDWIDELCDVLDLDTEIDEGLILDITRTAARNVTKVAGPITAYLLGVAAGSTGADPEEIERLAAKAQYLAEHWDRPANAPDPDDVDDEVPDDAGVDHTGDTFED